MSLFEKATAVADLRADRLTQLAAQQRPAQATSDDYLWGKLRAAEADAERHLRVYLTPTEIVPMGTPQSELDALEAAGARVVEEPGYDYDPDLFRGNSWGLIELRQKPIIKVHSIVFNYPEITSRIWTVPNDWIRPDKKYGRINLVPTNAVMTVPLQSYVLSALGGGRSVPLMMQVRYTAGLANVERDYPDLLDLVKKMAVLAVVDDKLMPQSGSVSADGLSQSISFDADKYRDAIDKKLDTLRQAIHGIRLMVM